jgi:hypothetical protein
VLLLFGLAWIVEGASFYLLDDIYANQPRYFPLDHLPLHVQGALWAGSGLVSCVIAFRPRREPDTLGFLAVSAMPMLLAASFLVGTATYILLDSRLWIFGALGFLAWAPIVLALAVIASWYEPPIIDGAGR